ncbi:hypothetical protein [Mycobacterium sp. 236(2023)]|uniref:hypothetical protein n=1 Tax=Mycobacterium sp. 236(2023) TaxID=3038163 RepID=UPI00241591B5|nr:hypothetical protein [Mycobacterium sp. 236(2023)]MDG4667341.1 hypothetical protein [Mycobacterium sp. 236(2023)]
MQIQHSPVRVAVPQRRDDAASTQGGHTMAENADLEKDAKEALLKAIRAATPSASTEGLRDLAEAYALTVGADAD